MNLNLGSVTRLTRFSAGRIDPERNWLTLLIGSAILLLIIVAWNVWAFETVVSGGTLGETHPAGAPSANVSALETISTVLDARAAEDNNYVSGAYRFADPAQ